MPRVIERFGGKHGHLGRCLIFVPDQQRQIPSEFFPNTMDLAISATQWLRDFNCTTVDGHVPDDLFFYYPNGTYTGALGMLQRSEFDTVSYIARPESLPFNPVLIGKVFSPADVGVGFRKKPAAKTVRELTSFVTEFPGIVYGYILIALFIFIVSFLIAERKKKRPFFKTLTPKRIAHMIEQTAYCLVDQETLDAETTPGRLVLLTLNILIVIFIYGLFLSKIGADLVVMKEPYNIQSIEDVIEPNSEVKPAAMKQLFLINLMKQASVYRPKSTLARLYSVIMSDPENNILNYDINNMDSMGSVTNEFLDRVMRRKSALLMPTEFFTWLRHFQCIINPAVISKMQIAQEAFAQGIMTFIYAPKIHPMVRKVFDYFFGCFFEMGLASSPMLRNLVAKDMLKTLPGSKITSEVTECQDIPNGASVSESDDSLSWRPFHHYDYLHVYEIMALFLTLAVFVLFIERKWFAYEKKRREYLNERRRKRMNPSNETLVQNLDSRQEKKETDRRQVNRIFKERQRHHFITRQPFKVIFRRPMTTVKLSRQHRK